MTAVILIAAVMCIAAIVGLVWLAERLDPPPRDPSPDPGGEQYITWPSGTRPGPDLDALTPGPVGTGRLEPLPDDDPADITGVQPPATRYLGTDLDQYVDELFSKHAEAQQ